MPAFTRYGVNPPFAHRRTAAFVPQVVSTYAVRGCQLTAEFIEEMATDVQITPSQSRSTLPSLPSQPSGARGDSTLVCCNEITDAGRANVHDCAMAPKHSHTECITCTVHVFACLAAALTFGQRRACCAEDGLGNPRLIQHERQGWREVLARVGAAPNKHLLMLVQGEAVLGGGGGGSCARGAGRWVGAGQ